MFCARFNFELPDWNRKISKLFKSLPKYLTCLFALFLSWEICRCCVCNPPSVDRVPHLPLNSFPALPQDVISTNSFHLLEYIDLHFRNKNWTLILFASLQTCPIEFIFAWLCKQALNISRHSLGSFPEGRGGKDGTMFLPRGRRRKGWYYGAVGCCDGDGLAKVWGLPEVWG